MDEKTRRKIEETVREILKNVDMAEMTEFKVRFAASKRLGIDLFGPEQKMFIRSIVEDFLLSGGDGEAVSDHPEKTREMVQEGEDRDKVKNEVYEDGYRLICKLSSKRNVMLNEYRGRTFVQIRDYYPKDGKQIPSPTGIALTIDQWLAFKQNLPAIEEAIKKMQSNLRGMSNSAEATKNRDMSNSAEAAKNGDVSNSVEATKNRDMSNSAEATKNGGVPKSVEATENGGVPKSVEATENGGVPNSVEATKKGDFTSAEATKNQDRFSSAEAVTHEFVPIETTRFDGKNYHSWAAKMEFFLQQLNIAYLLTDPPPSGPPSTKGNEESFKAKATDQKWLSDDHLCRHCILNTLSDPLYNQFSKKTYSAKELWEELRLVYLYEERGTKRSQVRKYIEFQFVDEKPVYEQVQELNNIADAIIATGMGIDENFHVSTILSKLPASWKDVSNKLMREENLPFWMLMERLRNEQDSRSGDKQGVNSKSAGFKSAGPGQRPGDSRKPGLSCKRQEPEAYRKPLACGNCGRRGHIAKVCWHGIRKGDMPGKSSPAVSDTNIVEKSVE